MKRLFTILLLSLCICGNALAAVLTIGLDMSGSNPLLHNHNFNLEAAAYIKTQIQNLQRGDVVLLKTFGDVREPKNFSTQRFEVGRSKKKLLKKINSYIVALPQEAQAQGSTQILAWFGRTRFACKAGDKVMLITDAIEASEKVNPNQLLAGAVQLPPPNEFINLEGCDITFFGLGVGRLDSEVVSLRRAWRKWFTKTGANYSEAIL